MQSKKCVSYYSICKILIHVSLSTDTLSPLNKRGVVCTQANAFVYTTRSRFSLNFNIFLENFLFFECISRHCLRQAQLKPKLNLDLFLRTFFTHETHLATLQLCYWLKQNVLFLMS